MGKAARRRPSIGEPLRKLAAMVYNDPECRSLGPF